MGSSSCIFWPGVIFSKDWCLKEPRFLESSQSDICSYEVDQALDGKRSVTGQMSKGLYHPFSNQTDLDSVIIGWIHPFEASGERLITDLDNCTE